MSCDISIDVKAISKCYNIYSHPRDRLTQFVLPRLQRFFRVKPKQYFIEFWALRDVSLEILKGETIGIVGRNGSGKSTLLQIICGTLSPTSGLIHTQGRIAALLELGAGFNPEFSGRENVYMNGAVFGLSKQQIDARFESITAFADIGSFIEQPVKTYSSGMYVRLAFAVIAHVDADILIIDEALAVGDAVFTQKCMRFLRKFKEHGTLLFVSHDMGAVINLCERAVWLHEGRIKLIGRANDVAKAYLQHTLQEVYGQGASLESFDGSNSSSETNLNEEAHLQNYGKEISALDYSCSAFVKDNIGEAGGWKTGSGEILAVLLENLSSPGVDVFQGGEFIRLRMVAKIYRYMARPILGFLVRDRLGQDLFGENTLPFTDLNPQFIAEGDAIEGEFVFRLPMLPNGQYSVMASLADGDLYSNVQHHWLHDALIITVTSSKVRWGLVGVHFDKVGMKRIHEELA